MKVCPICKAEYAGGEGFCPVDGSRLSTRSQMVKGPDPADPLVGISLGGRYKVIRAIGEGGMGIVYEAIHELIEKKVAIKVLRDDFSKRPEVVERFRQEAKSASRIGHEHIVDISDFGETPTGQSYFVMEYLDGEDLANILAREATLAPGRAVDIVLQCCRALGAAHAKGIVHRDMKPENVFLTKRDEQVDFVKIVDFGIAKMSDIETEGAPGRKLTKTGMIFGTPEYMSPEQAAGKELDHRVDVYALGVILFEALTGRVPFVGDTFMGILTQHLFEEVPPLRAINPSVVCPEALEVVILKALAKDPANRYAAMSEFGRALATAMDLSGAFHDDHTAPGYGEPVRAARRSPVRVEAAATTEYSTATGRGRMGLAIAAGVVVLAAAAVGGYFAFRPEASAANGPATVPPPIAAVPSDLGTTEEEELVEPVPVENGEPEVDTEPELLSVRVTTQPAGAEIEVDGRGVVCEPSPCSFETAPGTPLRIRAQRGRLAAVRDLTPSEAMEIEMVLARRGGGRPQAGGSEMSQGGGSHSSDLKIPDWAKAPR
jgi:serine/threonine-protein kinase